MILRIRVREIPWHTLPGESSERDYYIGVVGDESAIEICKA